MPVTKLETCHCLDQRGFHYHVKRGVEGGTSTIIAYFTSKKDAENFRIIKERDIQFSEMDERDGAPGIQFSLKKDHDREYYAILDNVHGNDSIIKPSTPVGFVVRQAYKQYKVFKTKEANTYEAEYAATFECLLEAKRYLNLLKKEQDQ